VVIFVSDNESWVDRRSGRGTATMREQTERWNIQTRPDLASLRRTMPSLPREDGPE